MGKLVFVSAEDDDPAMCPFCNVSYVETKEIVSPPDDLESPHYHHNLVCPRCGEIRSSYCELEDDD